MLNRFLLILLLCDILLIGTSINFEATYRFTRDYGIFSSTISAQQQIGKDPEQYFLCGFAFMQMKHTKLLWNCNCGYRLEGLSIVYKCDWCNNTFWTMANAFRATFCHYSDWNNQIIKTHQTGNAQSQNLRQFMCPEGTYARRAAARLAKDQGTDLGFVGMQLLCASPDLTSNYRVQDDYKYPLTITSTNPDRTFISGFQIKYQPNGKLTGINLMFQRMAIISSMQIKYIPTGTPKSVKNVFQTIYFGNAEKNYSEKILKPTKTYECLLYWNNLLPHIANYIIKENQGIKTPSIASTQQGNELSYKQDRPAFKFDHQIKNRLIPTSNMLISMEPRSVINATIFIEEIQISQAYEIKLVFSDIITGKKISQKSIKGIYTGVMISPIKVLLSTDYMKNIVNPSIYYTYFPTGEIDANQYKWTGDFGGYKGSVTSNVEVPFGYWLIGVQIICGWNLDSLIFEYTSNAKDFISRGWLSSIHGPSVGPSTAFRANYLNDEWITIINIHYDANILYGMDVVTNKGNKSVFCGRKLGSYIEFNAPWYRRFKANTNPYVNLINFQYMPWSK